MPITYALMIKDYYHYEENEIIKATEKANKKAAAKNKVKR